MKTRSLVSVCCLAVATMAWAGEKLAPDLTTGNPGAKWVLRGAKVVEEDGAKFFRLFGNKESGIALVSHEPVPVEGVRQVKVSLRYRTDVADSHAHSGAWYALAFSMTEGRDKYEALPLPAAAQWTEIEKVFDVPSGAVKLSPQLRLQINATNTLDASDIVIELNP